MVVHLAINVSEDVYAYLNARAVEDGTGWPEVVQQILEASLRDWHPDGGQDGDGG